MGDVRRLEVEREGTALTLDDLAREGARRMIAAALEAEVDEYIEGSSTSSTSVGTGWWP